MLLWHLRRLAGTFPSSRNHWLSARRPKRELQLTFHHLPILKIPQLKRKPKKGPRQGGLNHAWLLWDHDFFFLWLCKTDLLQNLNGEISSIGKACEDLASRSWWYHVRFYLTPFILDECIWRDVRHQRLQRMYGLQGVGSSAGKCTREGAPTVTHYRHYSNSGAAVDTDRTVPDSLMATSLQLLESASFSSHIILTISSSCFISKYSFCLISKYASFTPSTSIALNVASSISFNFDSSPSLLCE